MTLVLKYGKNNNNNKKLPIFHYIYVTEIFVVFIYKLYEIYNIFKQQHKKIHDYAK